MDTSGKHRSWFFLFAAALALVLMLWAALNFFVDPFGIFGDRLLRWPAYSQTLNPRSAKAAYISEHFDDYDSYILGSSTAASYLPETLNGYLDADFYNIFHYGVDTEYDRLLVSYLLENDNVKHIVLVLGLSDAEHQGAAYTTELTGRGHCLVTGENPWRYYFDYLFATPGYAWEKLTSAFRDTVFPQPFDVFLPETGCYDKSIREVEPIGALDAYLAVNGGDFSPADRSSELSYISRCAANVAAIRQMCDEAGTELTVILSPTCDQQLQQYSEEQMDAFFTALGGVTDYWNFSISSLSGDERYFYDKYHTRNAACNMVLARIFQDGTVYYPDRFGVYCQKGERVTTRQLRAAAESSAGTYTASIPILLYHHLTEDSGSESDYTLLSQRFEHQLDLLAENGYQTVSFDDLIAYVDEGKPLPDRAVVITFDDGYYSNYELGFPALEEHDFCATIFTIGCSLGHYEYYKDTEYSLTPHFGQPEISEMVSGGLISIQSHTYDMHQSETYDGAGARTSILPFQGETEAEYIEALTEDLERQDEAFAACGLEPSYVLAFPRGEYETLTNAILRQAGYRVTLTTDSDRINTLVAGLPQSLINLGRLTVTPDTTDDEILDYLSRQAP